MTWATWGMSSPRAATSVATSMGVAPLLKDLNADSLSWNTDEVQWCYDKSTHLTARCKTNDWKYNPSCGSTQSTFKQPRQFGLTTGRCYKDGSGVLFIWTGLPNRQYSSFLASSCYKSNFVQQYVKCLHGGLLINITKNYNCNYNGRIVIALLYLLCPVTMNTCCREPIFEQPVLKSISSPLRLHKDQSKSLLETWQQKLDQTNICKNSDTEIEVTFLKIVT